MPDRSWDDLLEENENEDYGTSWTPTKSPDQPRTLVGTVKDYERANLEMEVGEVREDGTRRRERPWICKVLDRDGQLWSVWLLGQVLRDEFARKQPEPGDRIVLRYVGKSKNPSPGRQPAQIYRLTTDRAGALPAFLGAPQLAPADANGAPQEEAVEDAEVVETAVGAEDDIPF